MVQISRDGNNFIFLVKGMHKLWTLKSKIIIPKENIIDASLPKDEFDSGINWRIAGTNLPFIYNGGMYYNKKNGFMFWDVANRNSCIVVNLQNEKYRKLILEVEDIEKALNLLADKK